jgi:BlaI family transcriptional regulator, penicillinase repressor
MARTPQDITDAELSVLEVLWEQGPAPIRRITEVLYEAARPSQYATVQKLLERLEDKKCVTRDRRGPIHRFAAAIDREELIGRRLRSVAEQLCGGSWTPLLTHLVQNQRLSPEERKALRDLIEEHDTHAKKPRR